MKIAINAQGRVLLVVEGLAQVPESLNGTALTAIELTDAEAAQLRTLQAGDYEGVQYTQGVLSGITRSPEAQLARVRAQLEAVLDRQVDAVARSMGYTSGVSCASYTASSNPTFAAEASAFVAWRDTFWAAAIAVLAEVQAGTRAVPTEAELLAAMPAFVAPGA